MIVAVICERMGWTSRLYYEQPLHFTELLIRKLDIDNKNGSAAAKKARAGSGVK
jgi:hypothetical protein